jgi:hypothetical protein
MLLSLLEFSLAKRIPSCLCQSQRREIGVLAGFFCLMSFTYFINNIYHNSDALSAVLFCNISVNNNIFENSLSSNNKCDNGGLNFCQVVPMGMGIGLCQ